MKNICLDCYTMDEFVNELISRLQPHILNQPNESPKNNVLTRKQAAALLNITLSTLNSWTKQGTIVSYRNGSRIYYKADELIASLEKRNFKNYKQR